MRAQVPASLVREEIEQSWRRSISHRVHPGAVPEALRELDPDSAILRAAKPIIDQWQTNLTGSRLALLLADGDGRIVSRRIVDAQDGKRLDRVHAAEGFDFSESTLGTNGLGTPLEARDVVFVQGSEHFNDSLEQLACAGGPIKHPITGRVVGSLSIASHIDFANPLMVAMVRQAGQQIAQGLEEMADSRDMELARTYRRYRSAQRPVLVMNSETVMTNLPPMAYLDAEAHALLWEKFRRHRWDRDARRLELPMLGTEAMVRRIHTGVHEAIYVLEFPELPQGEVVTGDLVLDAGSGASETRVEPVTRSAFDGCTGQHPRSSPYEDVQHRLTAAAAEGGLIHVVGSPGVGKRYQAVRWLRQRTGLEPKVVPAQDFVAHNAVRNECEGALRDGRGLVLTAPERLPDATRGWIDDFSRLMRNDAHPGARVILAERTDEYAGHTGEARSTEAGENVESAVVHIPSLTALRERLPLIVSEVSAEVFKNAPAPRFSPAALQCLLAWPWPGNVADLVRVLRSFPQVPNGELVQTKDLPAQMRYPVQPLLSRYQQAECDAINGALQEAQGNKVRAAEILGIGRTTLYRKMRTLKIQPRERMMTPDW